MRRLTVAALVSLSLSMALISCTESPTTPTPTQACVTNNSAQITFENRYTSQSIDVVWDGSKLTLSPLGPGAKSSELTVSAGVSHTLLFRVAGTSTVACAQSSPNLSQCSTYNYYCPGS
jgi:hypothetical protein